LAFAAKHCQQWDVAAAKFVDDMHACGWCGRVALGGAHSQLRRHMRPLLCTDAAGAPPGALANPLVMPLMRASEEDQVR
jgi:hypothetical protein